HPYWNVCKNTRQPNAHVQKFIESIAKVSNTSTTLWAFRTQHLPIMTQLFVQGANHEQLLQSLIPTVLSASIAGYLFISAFPVGYPYFMGHKPSEELYIRWVQACAFMPGLSFVLPPWKYNWS